jgi:hypothetical protein
MVRRGQTLLREYEGVSSPKRRRAEALASFLSQSVTFLSSTFCRRVGKTLISANKDGFCWQSLMRYRLKHLPAQA